MNKSKLPPQAHRLLECLRHLTSAEFRAMYEALGQYVENNEDALGVAAPGDTSGVDRDLHAAAEGLLEGFDALFAAQADKVS